LGNYTIQGDPASYRTRISVNLDGALVGAVLTTKIRNFKVPRGGTGLGSPFATRLFVQHTGQPKSQSCEARGGTIRNSDGPKIKKTLQVSSWSWFPRTFHQKPGLVDFVGSAEVGPNKVFITVSL